MHIFPSPIMINNWHGTRREEISMTMRDHKSPKMMMIMMMVIIRLSLVVNNHLLGTGWLCNDAYEGLDDGEPESDEDNKDQASGDPAGELNWPRRPRSGHGPEGPQGLMGPVVPVFMNLHAKCPMFSGKEGEHADSHLLCSNDWTNSQSIAKDATCGWSCWTLGGDVHFWISNPMWAMIGTICKDFLQTIL